MSIFKIHLHISKQMCTFAPDFETVSFGIRKPDHKSGNLICTFEFQLLAQFDPDDPHT